AFSSRSGTAGDAVSSKALDWLLLLLLMWGWADDLVVSTANADPLDDAATSDWDEYVPPAPPCGHTRSAGRSPPAPGVLSPRNGRISPTPPFLSRNSTPERHILSGTDRVYAFKSLQC